MIEVLVSTLNTDNVENLLKKMNLTQVPSVVINQSNQVKNSDRLITKEHYKLLESSQLGLAKSRNAALALANDQSICQLADDDMVFADNYTELVKAAYEEFSEADIIVFFVNRNGVANEKAIIKKGPIGYLLSMKISSVQVTFKKKSVMDKGIIFDDRFGIGTYYGSGEENIFLFDCLRKGLKLYSYPVEIAYLMESQSNWDRTITPENCRKRGGIYKRMSPKWYWVIILQFAIRKRKLCRPIGVWANIKYMFQGAAAFNRGNKQV